MWVCCRCGAKCGCVVGVVLSVGVLNVCVCVL